MPDTALVVMARYPQIGTTKTRLARTIGDEETVRLYRAFLTDLAHKFAGHMCDLHWAYTPPEVDYLVLYCNSCSNSHRAYACISTTGDRSGRSLTPRFSMDV